MQETGQISLQPRVQHPWLIIGNLSLKGEAFCSNDDLNDFLNVQSFNFLVAAGTNLNAEHAEVKYLRELNSLQWIAKKHESIQRSNLEKLPNIKFSKSAARLIQILSVGEHPCLLAGSVGSGKSTIISNVAKLLEPASVQSLAEIKRVKKLFAQNSLSRKPEIQSSRPIVIVHHSISPIAFLGGGSKLHPGEITRAHKGVLLMDEFLEFNSEIQEALREPLENAKLTIARGGQFINFPTDILLLATSNLCRCGQFAMNSSKKCRCSQTKLKRYLAKIIGPCFDRFQILAFSSCWENQTKEVEIEKIQNQIQIATQFRITSRGQNISNSKISIDELNNLSDQQFVDNYFKIDFMSERRKLALKKVARTIADLESSERVRIQHLNEALSLTVSPYLWLEQAQRACVEI